MFFELVWNEQQASDVTARGAIANHPSARNGLNRFSQLDGTCSALTLEQLSGEQLLSGNFYLPPINIAELFSRAYERGGLTRADRLGLMSAFLANVLTDEEHLAINRLLYSFRRGRLQFLD
ncbi:MAG: hypothetical protein ACM37W_19960 [Actinomycetota bacterium]